MAVEVGLQSGFLLRSPARADEGLIILPPLLHSLPTRPHHGTVEHLHQMRRRRERGEVIEEGLEHAALLSC
ncbi:hypothetical protein [Sinorhizobium meliloti]|uniref:hypothetical protein n=1 Tax=Rhizobium meliloti TaxID=382 RepID=UPI000FD5F05E|nr:hypothetical protein [Sinorhizobium meliloti]RVJ65201.1 hypothetical protein CN171_33790 [Sinorhizobium meliloti]